MGCDRQDLDRRGRRITMAKLTRRHLLGAAASGLLAGGAGKAAAARHGLRKAPAVLRGASPPRPVIMLDPGHGGKDPGAIGVSGTYEKHIAVAAATELRALLMASGRYDVVLSRTDDRFIPLAGRVELAHRHKADLFISMHADALHQSDVRGASVYTLSGNASDRQTALLAETENSADRFAGPGMADVPPDVEEILNSLVHEETRRGSAHMAASVIRSFQNRIQLLHHPSRHAAFRVLKSGDIPSVLVEMGFMSNHLDEQALRRAAHRTQITQAMKQAIDGYFLRQRKGML
ncbi:N-acetylmuramoyl-L-alanine amidase [Parasaccharibacter sp. TMW 2.1891]|uniref:N-acetylmuramoyl-L-alanine amidase n=2 Tax=Acetobacterales TaxID=3120395 RepID=A0ABR9MM11_9PROT|nr:N-acetylmuramoyl-L-alanine amidase [Bombella apis]MBR9730712.1 N-acetylmuramoyl-L-alanine amidase [Bombella apis]MCL1513007.1 N-acetylmuramoyl-L-alanine amidase [Parasaccharibacter sp. TMW 2.1891]